LSTNRILSKIEALNYTSAPENEKGLRMLSFKGCHFPKDVILMAVRWKLAYPLSYRNIEELMEERDANLEHSTVQKWVVHYSPQLEDVFRKRKKPVGNSWKVDETYIKVNGKWVYFYRAVVTAWKNH
jgi:putative transposase